MSTARRLAAALVMAVLAFGTFPAFGVDEPATTTDTSTDTTVAGGGATEELDVAPPAVTVPTTEADETPADWTYRYLIPTLLALAVVVVIATTVQYFLRVVRNRYKVVE